MGAAVGLVSDGACAKTLQDGVLPLGINWLGALTAAFDWGLVTVVALHVAEAIIPRSSTEPAEGSLELAALFFIPAGALILYLFDAFVGRTRFERMLGPVWLLADMLFFAAAAALVRRAVTLADESSSRDSWLWGLAALCGWLPGAQLFARAGAWPNFMSIFSVVVWTAGFGFWMRSLWLKRNEISSEPRREAAPILALAAWRFLGAVTICLTVGSLESDDRAASAFGFFVDLPTRILFISLFFSSNPAV
ncbi:MAG: hypothetical protein ACHQ2Z_10365 [Elusimicrobiota bacterium]